MATNVNRRAASEQTVCARCASELRPGSGAFYVVTIDAVADPTPPALPAEEAEDVRAEIQRVLALLEGVSEREAMDEVHRRVVLHLCRTCFRRWIECPAG